MRFVWVGFHTQGVVALDALLAAGYAIQAVLTLRPNLAAARGGGGDYQSVCRRYGVPLHPIGHINEPDTTALLTRLAPDVLFVIGWPQVVRGPTLAVARTGVIGAHASLLPANHGPTPIVWALARGERMTGSTLLWLAEPPSSCAVIEQAALPITPYDTCATLYDKVGLANRDMLMRLVPRLIAGERVGRIQAAAGAPLPRRRRGDARIDWNRPAAAIYDLVRASTQPYQGAFSTLDEHQWIVWQAALPPPIASAPATPGEVLGGVVSPVPEACGQLVACGTGTIVLLEVESADGTVLKGPPLSEQSWIGRRWQ